MRIVHVINSLNIGGAETLLRGLLNEWDDEHHVVVLQGRGELSEDIEKLATSLTHLGCSKATSAVGKMVYGLWSTVRRLRPDVVHSHLVQSDLVSLLCPMGGVKRYTSIHISGMGTQDPARSHFIAKVVGRFSHRFTRAIATSEESKQYMSDFGYKCPVTVIHNGTPKVEPVAYEADQGITFLSLARFHEVKGHAHLISAFAEHFADHPTSALICAGAGVSLENAEFVTAVGPEAAALCDAGVLHFVGPQRDIRSLFARAQALVISSTGTETFPMVGSEACMHGVPVITTDVGAAKSFAIDERWVVNPGSPSELADAMNQFASITSDERALLSKLSRERALAEFDISRIAEQYTQAYRQSSISQLSFPN